MRTLVVSNVVALCAVVNLDISYLDSIASYQMRHPKVKKDKITVTYKQHFPMAFLHEYSSKLAQNRTR